MDIDGELGRVLDGSARTEPLYGAEQIRRETVWVTMRDGIRLATEVYLPPGPPATPAPSQASQASSATNPRLPTIVTRTPYGRVATGAAEDDTPDLMATLARHGYAAVAQDVRATGDSEPDVWDMYIYELEDSYDTVEWVTHQPWYDGFIGGTGGSYVAGTQWSMAMHPAMTAMAPEVGTPGTCRSRGVKWHMFMNAYARSVGKGEDKVAIDVWEMERRMADETLATGYFNEPIPTAMPDAILARYPDLGTMAFPDAQAWLWRHYCSSPPQERAAILRASVGSPQVTYENLEAIPPIFMFNLHPDTHLWPIATVPELFGAVRAPALIINGWYDWGLDITLQCWELMQEHARPAVREQSRLHIGPGSHFTPGYREGTDPSLFRTFRGMDALELLLLWYGAVRGGPAALEAMPRVTYYLMGANEWRTADDWPPEGMRIVPLHLADGGRLQPGPEKDAGADAYVYDPTDPTPTLGGNIVSTVYPPGSVDVAAVQERPDVVTYSSDVLAGDVDIAGPLRATIWASTSARDTDFVVRLTDVWPDGRAIQIANGIVRARYRDQDRPELLELERVYDFEVDLWGTAFRFAAGHRIRIDVSSSDFPRYERHTNLAGEPGTPRSARQQIHRGPETPSRMELPVIAGAEFL